MHKGFQYIINGNLGHYIAEAYSEESSEYLYGSGNTLWEAEQDIIEVIDDYLEKYG